jgi:hypothetical protein
VSVKELTSTGARLYVRALKRGTPVLTARLGSATGPILMHREIDEFTMDVPARWHVITFDVGGAGIGTSPLTIRTCTSTVSPTLKGATPAFAPRALVSSTILDMSGLPLHSLAGFGRLPCCGGAALRGRL